MFIFEKRKREKRKVLKQFRKMGRFLSFIFNWVIHIERELILI